ncbi:hypothetical protein [Nocardia sp. SC052]
MKLTGADNVVLEVNTAQLRGLSAAQVLELTGKLASDLDPGSGLRQ